MLDMATQCFKHCSWVGGVAGRRRPFLCRANNSESLLEKLLCCLHIPVLAQARINQVAICVNSAIQITPFSSHFDVGLIHIPRWPCLPTSFDPQLFCNKRGKLLFPLPNCLMGKHPSPFEKHLGEISQAQLVPKSPQDNQKDHI